MEGYTAIAADGPERELDEDGVCTPYVKTSAKGGKGLFSVGKPAPIEYKRDVTLAAHGFISACEADRLWAAAEGPVFDYLMEVGLDTQFYRDEVDGGGELRPIAAMGQCEDALGGGGEGRARGSPRFRCIVAANVECVRPCVPDQARNGRWQSAPGLARAAFGIRVPRHHRVPTNPVTAAWLARAGF